MLGAIAGDVIGAIFEHCPTKREDFALFHIMSKFTDDSVLTVAVAAAIMDNDDYAGKIQYFAARYPNRGYGGMFTEWITQKDPKPYNSFGNGSAMRVSPVGFAFDDEDTVLLEAKKSAECTHDHPEGIKGAQATALAILRARKGSTKADIKEEIEARFGYDLNRDLSRLRLTYQFDVTCQGSVPEAIICFLESSSYEDTIRKAVSLGGDADTQACIAGGIAEAFYDEIPPAIETEVRKRLDAELKEVVDRFQKKYMNK
jgi:ADP-ribosylglycohydrolase